MDHTKVWNILTLQPLTDAPDELQRSGVVAQHNCGRG